MGVATEYVSAPRVPCPGTGWKMLLCRRRAALSGTLTKVFMEQDSIRMGWAGSKWLEDGLDRQQVVRRWAGPAFRIFRLLSRVGARDLEIPAFAPRSQPPHARAPGAQTIRMASDGGSLDSQRLSLDTLPFIPSVQLAETRSARYDAGGPQGGWGGRHPSRPTSRTTYSHQLNPKGRTAPHQR
eukprot:gene10656-biopygen4798